MVSFRLNSVTGRSLEDWKQRQHTILKQKSLSSIALRLLLTNGGRADVSSFTIVFFKNCYNFGNDSDELLPTDRDTLVPGPMNSNYTGILKE